jgi:hypothetical protein
MKQLLDRAPVIGTGLATLAGAATVFYLLGLGIACRFPVLSHCDIVDYARLAVVWLAPVVFVALIFALSNLGLGKHWWLVVYVPALAVVGMLAVLFPGRSPSPAATPISLVMLATVVALVLLGIVASSALRRAQTPRREIVYALTYAAFLMVFALSWGLSSGFEVMATRDPTIAVHIRDAAEPLSGVQVVHLHEALIIRTLPGGKFFVVPAARIQLIEQLP